MVQNRLNELGINILTQAQYEKISDEGTVNENEIYMVPETEGPNITIDSEISDTSINPVQNKVVKKYIDEKGLPVVTTNDNGKILQVVNGIWKTVLSSVSEDIFNTENKKRYNCETPAEAFKKIVNELLVIIPASGWSLTAGADGWFTNRVNVAEMKAVYNPLVTLVVTSATLADDEQTAFSVIKEIETFDGYVICKALEPADIDFKVRFTGV